TSQLADVEVGLHGTINSQASPLGVLFTQSASGAQQFIRPPSHDDDGILLVQHVDGEAQFKEGDRTIVLAAGDLVIVGGGARLTLDFATSFRQVLVKVPRMVVNARMLSLKSSKVLHFPGRK